MASTQPPSRASNILVVDDETDPRRNLALLLTSAGFTVLQAADAAEADERLAGGSVGIALLDGDMPRCDGFQLCEAIRKKHGAAVYVILRTTTAQLAARDLSVDEGADDFLVEPVSDKELLARIETGRKMKQLQEKLDQSNKALELLEVTDPQTGAYSKRHIQAELRREMDRSNRYGNAVSLVLIDLDNFRALNDRLGRAAGDRVIEELARILRLSTRATDTVGRFGGEEFAIVLPETSRESALGAAEKIRKIVSQTAIAAEDRTLYVTVSAGVAAFANMNFESVDNLVAAADEALAQAKAGGRNRCDVSPR